MLHPPPGRSGRLWAIRRRDVAQRGVDLLNRKRSALQQEQQGWLDVCASRRREWEASVAEMSLWSARAGLLGGRNSLLRMNAARGDWTPSVDVKWESTMGVELPVAAVVTSPSPQLGRAIAGSGGTAAADRSYASVMRASVAAADVAVAEKALEAITRELRTTAQRIRLLEKRRIPDLRRFIQEIEFGLDEYEREQGVRARWAVSGRRDQ
jgi:V/A-type H+/Na+-transporting ATPase subunit D